jgi:hypothetical protein
MGLVLVASPKHPMVRVKKHQNRRCLDYWFIGTVCDFSMTNHCGATTVTLFKINILSNSKKHKITPKGGEEKTDRRCVEEYMGFRGVFLSSIILAGMPSFAGELSSSAVARFLLVISKGAGEGGKVMCSNESMASELRRAGVDVVSSGRVAWASGGAEARTYQMQGRLVVCGDLSTFRTAGAIALLEEDGKPKMLLNTKNVAKSGVAISDQILKAASVQP